MSGPDADRLAERIETLERALTDGHELADLPEGADLAARVESTDDRVADLEERVTELEAAVQALRGYVGNVRSVNRDVERRADAALAAVERLEETDDDLRTVLGDLEEPGSALAFEGPASEDGDREDGDRHAAERAGDVVDRVRDSLRE